MSRAIFIDTENKKVTELKIADLTELQELVKGYIERAPLPEFTGSKTQNILYVNDEGLFKFRDSFFIMGQPVPPYLGNGVICAIDKEGKQVDTDLSLDEVKKRVVYLN